MEGARELGGLRRGGRGASWEAQRGGVEGSRELGGLGRGGRGAGRED